MSANPRVYTSWLPDTTKAEMDFVDSSFFSVHGPNPRLPTPAEVRALSPASETDPRPRPVKFEHLDLLVKFGHDVAIEEAQCLWIVRRLLGQEVPVPELYG